MAFFFCLGSILTLTQPFCSVLFFVGFCLYCFEDIWTVHVSPCNHVLSKLICSVTGFNYHGFGLWALNQGSEASGWTQVLLVGKAFIRSGMEPL